MDEQGHRIRDHLARLEDAPLPDDLWTRVAAARRRRMGARLVGTATCGALVAAFAVVLMQPGGLMQQEGGPPALAVEAPVGAPLAAPAVEEEIYHSVQVIDRALQVAYDRQATDEEVAPLWRARQDLMLAAATVHKNG